MEPASRRYVLVTVNTAPDRARRLVGQMIDALKDRYHIVHAANCETIDQVQPVVSEKQPDLLFCASMWSSDQVEKIQRIARSITPGIVIYVLPHGLQVEKGPDAVVDHLVANVPQLLDQLER